MKLIERTTPESLQSFAISNSEGEPLNPSFLVRSNLLQRFLRYIKCLGYEEEEFKKNLDNIVLRISSVQPKIENSEVKKTIIIGTLSFPTFNKNTDISPEVFEEFKASGVELPREAHLSERLKELTFSGEDPFRMTSIEYQLIKEESLRDMSFSNMEEESQVFYDFLYSSNSASIKEKLKATYILSVSKVFQSDPSLERKFSDQTISKIVNDITDLDTRREIFDEIKKFHLNPHLRPKMIEESNRCLRMSTEGGKGPRKAPIKTWKIIAACVILILGVLAYTQRNAIKAAWEISKTSKDMESSKFSIFVRALFSSEGREHARDYVNDTSVGKASARVLSYNDSDMKRHKANVDQALVTKERVLNFFKKKNN